MEVRGAREVMPVRPERFRVMNGLFSQDMGNK